MCTSRFHFKENILHTLDWKLLKSSIILRAFNTQCYVTNQFQLNFISWPLVLYCPCILFDIHSLLCPLRPIRLFNFNYCCGNEDFIVNSCIFGVNTSCKCHQVVSCWHSQLYSKRISDAIAIVMFADVNVKIIIVLNQ